MKRYWKPLTVVIATLVILITVPRLASIAMATGALRGTVDSERYRLELSRKAALYIVIDAVALGAIIFAGLSRRKDL